MIVGLGIDLVDVARMERLLERHPERAPARLFTDEERSHCGGRASPAECLAARFAAKEAFLKALGTGYGTGIAWREIEVRSSPRGRPSLRISGLAARELQRLGGSRVHLSFTHEGGYAVAIVLLESATPSGDTDDGEG